MGSILNEVQLNVLSHRITYYIAFLKLYVNTKKKLNGSRSNICKTNNTKINIMIHQACLNLFVLEEICNFLIFVSLYSIRT